MIKQTKFGRVENSSGFTLNRLPTSNDMYVKIDSTRAAHNAKVEDFNKQTKVWVDSARIKSWWKLW